MPILGPTDLQIAEPTGRLKIIQTRKRYSRTPPYEHSAQKNTPLEWTILAGPKHFPYQILYKTPVWTNNPALPAQRTAVCPPKVSVSEVFYLFMLLNLSCQNAITLDSHRDHVLLAAFSMCLVAVWPTQGRWEMTKGQRRHHQGRAWYCLHMEALSGHVFLHTRLELKSVGTGFVYRFVFIPKDKTCRSPWAPGLL